MKKPLFMPSTLSEYDHETLAALRSLIANIEAGNVHTVSRSGEQLSDDTVAILFVMEGKPENLL